MFSLNGRPRLVAAMSAILVASLLLLSAPSALGAAKPVPMPGERFLTQAERQWALATMHDLERAELGHLFADEASELVVAYARREFALVEQAGGTFLPEPVGPVRDVPESGLSFPSRAIAGTATKPGTDIYISVVITRLSGYNWKISAWADWSFKASPAGMDWYNSAEDSIGLAWAGGLALKSDTMVGYYGPKCGWTNLKNMPIYRSDAAPNVGVGYSFREWDPVKCDRVSNRPMRYASVTATITESSWKSRISNVVMKYFHTWASQSYSLGFSAGGPSVSISPTSNQWSIAAYTSFSH